MAVPAFIASLKPRPEMRQGRPLWTCLKEVTWMQWAQFWVGWLAWSCDAIDFFSVSLSVTNLQESFGKSAYTITTSITLTLLFRSIGAVVFGVISDRFGRKWPLVFNLALCSVIELGSGFVKTYPQFLAARSLFGVAMGSIWGLSASSALENLPVELRGLAYDVLQQGYAAGYLIAAVVYLYLVPEQPQGWRALFWTGAGISMFAACLRACLPESEVFRKAKELERLRGSTTGKKTKVFIRETGHMLKKHWVLCIYAVLLMTGFNFLSHGSQDLYPTYLKSNKGLSSHDATVATIIGNVGAVVGGAIAGYGLAAGAFCIQFGVQGAWGVIPIQLAEMSPPAFRATFPGVAYQVGNMISSASAQIEATGGDNLKTTLPKIDPATGRPTVVPDYAEVQGILIGVVVAFVIFITLIGPENHASHFEKAKTAFEEGGGNDEEDLAPAGGAGRKEGAVAGGDVEKGSVDDEKQEDERISNA
ncbi:carboxylic acid transporter protein [Athelia psychrophila]|uniref:Carboxylic acid transporter protein n=1 Tax=Athelia psychrophila TaxID=1759441 RepID=A0A166K053_9AGAM|nr:carboxylic acid transporter protein [Fibularhizoctonia sp. CBS 109695]